MITLKKGDMFTLEPRNIECIVGREEGITLILLRSGNILSVPKEVCPQRKLVELVTCGLHVTNVNCGEITDETDDEFWERVRETRGGLH